MKGFKAMTDYEILMDLCAEYDGRSLEMGKAAAEFESDGQHKDAKDCRRIAERHARQSEALYNAAITLRQNEKVASQ